MRIVVAPDSYKGSLSALGVAKAMAEGVLAVLPGALIEKVPMADGGEGTVDAIIAGGGGEKYFTQVTGPLGEPVEGFYGILADGTGVLEMAAASGLTLVPLERRNPLKTTTYGTGELIKRVLDQGVAKIIVGIGGSATNDGGVGMAQALGVRFLDREGRELGFGGGELNKLHRIDMEGMDPRLEQTEILVACDVDNPLIGSQGASAVFGPQKGATPAMVGELDKALAHLGEVVLRDLGLDIRQQPGAGAAGGLGGGLIAFLGASLLPGFQLVAQALELENKIAQSHLVLTGEGRTDGQTRHGKTPLGVGQLARKYQVPAIAISGSVEGDLATLYQEGLDGIFSILPGPMSLEQAMAEAPRLVTETTANIIRLFKILKG